MTKAKSTQPKTVTDEEAERLRAAISREHRTKIANGTRSTLDWGDLSLRKSDILQRMTTAAELLSEKAPPRAEFFIEQARLNFDAVAAAAKIHVVSTPATRKFTDKAKRAARDLGDELTSVRNALSERVQSSDAADDMKKDLLIGDGLNPDAVQLTKDLSEKMMHGLRTHAGALEEAGVDAEPLIERLDPLYKALVKELETSPATPTTRGEASEKVDSALLMLDIVFYRFLAFLRNYGAAEGAEALEARIPRKHSRRSTDKRDSGEGGDTNETATVTEPLSRKVTSTATVDAEKPTAVPGKAPASGRKSTED